MSWTTRPDLKKAVDKLWSNGALLRAAWSGQGLEFPYRINLKGPSSIELSERYDDARRWIAGLEDLPLVWRDFTHPRLGANRVPIAVEWGSRQELAVFAGCEMETRRFLELAGTIAERFPPLAVWIEGHPHRVLEHREVLGRLLDVADWVQRHPRPGVHLRQVDVPGVHSKFLENHRGLLSEWLDLILPPEAVDESQKGVGRFAERYGFAVKPRLVRFRPLDSLIPGPRDLAWRIDDWAAWDQAPSRVVITENEINYLSLPELPRTWAVFGSGYGFEGWEQAAWLLKAAIWYWGDLDTHGFAILDQLRSVVPHARSLLMDETTLLSHREFWGTEDRPADRELTRLTNEEQAVYQGLLRSRWGTQVRLEQEHIRFGWVGEALGKIG